MKIHQKMAAIQAEFPTVGKDNKNPSQGYNYRGIDDALAHLNPLMRKHGVYVQLMDLVPEFSDAGETKAGKSQVRCVVSGRARFVCGEDGSYTECSVIGEGIDMGDKALMKAQANGLKYTIWYTFGVPTYELRDSEAFEEPAPAKAPPKKASAPKGGDEADALVKQINSVKNIDALKALGVACKSYCLAQPENSPGRARVANAYTQREQEFLS